MAQGQVVDAKRIGILRYVSLQQRVDVPGPGTIILECSIEGIEEIRAYPERGSAGNYTIALKVGEGMWASGIPFLCPPRSRKSRREKTIFLLCCREDACSLPRWLLGQACTQGSRCECLINKITVLLPNKKVR